LAAGVGEEVVPPEVELLLLEPQPTVTAANADNKHIDERNECTAKHLVFMAATLPLRNGVRLEPLPSFPFLAGKPQALQDSLTIIRHFKSDNRL
jgi:hypothetical protein